MKAVYNFEAKHQLHSKIGSFIPGDGGILACPYKIDEAPSLLISAWKPVIPIQKEMPKDLTSQEEIAENAAIEYIAIVKRTIEGHSGPLVFSKMPTSRKVPRVMGQRGGNPISGFLNRNPEPLRSILHFFVTYFSNTTKVLHFVCSLPLKFIGLLVIHYNSGTSAQYPFSIYGKSDGAE